MEYEKDYSLLRPFDLEAAKRGEAIIDTDGDECKYVAGPHKETAEIVVEFPYDLGFMTCMDKDLRMAPLAWVPVSKDDPTLRPVYKGDVLWHEVIGRVEILALGKASTPCVEVVGRGDFPWISALTWTPPKVKREGWIAILTAERPKGDKYTHWCSHICATEQLARDYYGSSTNVIVAPVSWEEPAA